MGIKWITLNKNMSDFTRNEIIKLNTVIKCSMKETKKLMVKTYYFL